MERHRRVQSIDDFDGGGGSRGVEDGLGLFLVWEAFKAKLFFFLGNLCCFSIVFFFIVPFFDICLVIFLIVLRWVIHLC